jgi:hypothetical protein
VASYAAIWPWLLCMTLVSDPLPARLPAESNSKLICSARGDEKQKKFADLINMILKAHSAAEHFCCSL